MTHYKQMELNLLSSQEDFHAKTSQLQENKKESSENDHLFGRSMRGSSKMYGQHGRLLKMYQPFDLKDLHWSYKIFARSAICLNFTVYPLPTLGLGITAPAFGFLRVATPTAKANQLSPSMMKHKGCRNMLDTINGQNRQLNPLYWEWLMGYPSGWTD